MHLPRCTFRFALAVTLLTRAQNVHAQQVQGALAVTGGSATDVLGVTSRAVTLAPSLTFLTDPRAVFGIAGSATQFDNRQWSAGGGATAALRAPFGHFAAVTLDGGANATTTSYDFSYYTASAIPALEGDFGAVTAYVGGHGALASASVPQQLETPGGLLGFSPVTSTSTVDVSRTMRGALFGANVRIPAGDGVSFVAGVREEHATIDTVATVDRSASLNLVEGMVAIGGTLGMRREPVGNTTFGSAALSLAVKPSVSVDVSVGSYPSDRLIGTPGGRYLNLGISLHTGRTSSANRLSPEGAPTVPAGFTRLAIRDDDASRVDVAGDFTNWKPVATQRAPNGVWYVDLRIPAGRYRYAFRINGSDWRIPDGATAVDDDLGSKSAWLVVSASTVTTHQEEQ